MVVQGSWAHFICVCIFRNIFLYVPLPMVLCGLHFVHSGPVLLRESFTLSKLSVISKQLNLLNGREPIFCER